MARTKNTYRRGNRIYTRHEPTGLRNSGGKRLRESDGGTTVETRGGKWARLDALEETVLAAVGMPNAWEATRAVQHAFDTFRAQAESADHPY